MTEGAPGTLGRYRLLRQLAADEISETFTARPVDASADGSGADIVLLQRLRLSAAQLDSVREPLSRAAVRARQLDHPCVAAVLECQLTGADAYVVMQAPSPEPRCLGTAMDELHARGERMPGPEVARIGSAIASGLHYLHSRNESGSDAGLVYSSLVPDAIMLGAGDRVQLAGLSMHVVTSAVTLLSDRRIAYQSPEQVSGPEVDHRSDLFALGALLCELASGQRLFTAPNVFELLRRIREVSDETVRAHLGDAVPEPLQVIIRRALQRAPDDRYQSAHDMAQELADCAARMAEAEPRGHQVSTPSEPSTVHDAEVFAGAKTVPSMPAAHDSVGKYEILHSIGQGGMGDVFLAYDRSLDRQVAIKMLPPHLAADERLVARFKREAFAVARMSHDNIVQVYEVDLWHGRPYIAMEYLEGESLRKSLQQGPLPVPRVVAIAAQIAEGMAAAHESGILHRDLKPENIALIKARSRVKILDFGIAKLRDQPQTMNTLAGTILGTPAYMSPEQTRDSANVDARSDIYSFGCVLYEMACGAPPFAAASAIDLLMAHVSTPPPDPLERVPHLPDQLARLILSMLAKDPADRPQSMTAVRAALESLARTPAAAVDDAVKARLPGGVPSDAASETIHPTIQDAPAVSAEAKPPPTETSAPDTPDLESLLPPTMAGAHVEIRAFLEALFERYEHVASHCLRLFGPRVQHADSYTCFALFVSALGSSPAAAPLGQLGTQTFVHSAGALDAQLRELGPGLKIVIAIADSAELGPGVREKILHYRKQFEAVVIPMYVGELRKAYHDRQLTELFNRRVSDFHTLPDPYMASGPPDATQFFGMRALVNELVDRICKDTPVITITGPPGSGKSSLVVMAEYGLHDHAFTYVRCPATARRGPLELVKKIAAALPVPVDRKALDAQQDIDKALTFVTGILPAPSPASPASIDKAHKKPVLVLEDADWLITTCIASNIPAAQADEVRAMWSALAELCRAGRMTLIITSIRGFWLSRRVLGQWENPLRPHAIDMPHLDYQALDELVRQLGVTINVHYDQAAIRAIHRLSAGNVYTVRALGSRIVRNLRERADHHALAQLTIGRREVHEAAEQLVSLARVYDETVLPWLDENERQVLMSLASQPPGSSRALQRALGDRLGETRVRDAFTALQNMGLATARRKQPGQLFSRRRHRVAIPLLSRWIRGNLEQSSHERRDQRRRRLGYLVVGLSLSAVLAGVYIAWFQTGRALASADAGGPCTCRVDHPLRATPGDTIRVHVYRRCTRAPTEAWSLKAPEAPADIKPADPAAQTPEQRKDQVMLCTDAGEELDCREPLDIEFFDSAGDQYDFEVAAGQQPVLAFAVRKDPLATFKRRFELVFQIAALLPLLFSFMLAFHTEVSAAFRRMLRAFKDTKDKAANLAPTAADAEHNG